MHRNKEIIRSFLWQLLPYGISVNFQSISTVCLLLLRDIARDTSLNGENSRNNGSSALVGENSTTFSERFSSTLLCNVVLAAWRNARGYAFGRNAPYYYIILFVRSFCWLTVEFFVRFLRGGFHGTIFTFQETFSLLLQELFYSSLYSFRRTYILDFKRISVEFLRRVFREIIICLYLIYGIVGSLSFIKDFLPCFWRNFRFTLRSLFFRPTFFGFSKNFCLIFDGSF